MKLVNNEEVMMILLLLILVKWVMRKKKEWLRKGQTPRMTGSSKDGYTRASILIYFIVDRGVVGIVSGLPAQIR